MNGEFKFMNGDFEQSYEKSHEAYENEKSFYKWLEQMVMMLKKDFPFQWNNLSALPDVKTDKTALIRETEALTYVSQYC